MFARTLRTNPNQPFVKVFALGMPLAFLLLGLGLWVVPLRAASQRALFVCMEVVYAWAAMEVFVVAITAALLEISQFAQFIIGAQCDAIDKALAVRRTMLPA